MVVVEKWTGREAGALRRSLRMTVQVFADRLGAATRTVAYWESRGAAVTPQPDMQAALDTFLARSDAEAQHRFKLLLGEQTPSAEDENEQQQRERLVDELLDRLAEAAGAAGLTRPDRPGEAVRRALREANRLTVAIASLPGGEQRPTLESSDCETRESGGMDRRTVVRLFGALGVVAARPGTAEHLLGFAQAEAATNVGHVDAELLARMREVTLTYAQAWGEAPAAELAGLTRAHLNTVAPHLEATASAALRARLGSVTAETAALAGWLTCLQDRRGEARSLFLFARDTARDAQDSSLHALVLGSLAYLDSPVPRGAAGGSRVAVRRLSEALTLLPGAASAAARSWLHAQLAVEYAALDDRPAFEQHIGLAEAAAASSKDGSGPGVFSVAGVLTFWGSDGTGVTKSRGLGEALLGSSRAAESIGSTISAGGSPLGEATLLLDLAAGQIRTGQFQPACEASVRALNLLAGGGYTARVRRVRGLRAQITDDWLPAVRELDEHLATAGR